METEAVVEEEFLDVVENSEMLPCHSLRHGSVSVPARNHQKLSVPTIEEKRSRPPNSYCNRCVCRDQIHGLSNHYVMSVYCCRVLKVYPNGVGSAKGNSLSLYLLSASNENGYVQAKLPVISQIQSTHVEKQVEGWPSAADNGWGFDKFIPLADLKDTSKGFLVNDTLKVEVQILSFSKVDSL